MAPKDSKAIELKAIWHGIPLSLTNEEYRIAMSHVEDMRHTAEEEDFYSELDEEDEDYLDPYGWTLSDTLENALEEGRRSSIEVGQKPDDLTAIKRGLRILAEYLTIFEPCADEGADDVF
jgi:hypothetical protein